MEIKAGMVKKGDNIRAPRIYGNRKREDNMEEQE